MGVLLAHLMFQAGKTTREFILGESYSCHVFFGKVGVVPMHAFFDTLYET